VPVAIRQFQPHGSHAAGRIARLFVGQGYGFIRLADNREIYFHRADICEGTSFNDLSVGDAVTFELLEDRVSGPRALQLRRSDVRGDRGAVVH
jgi:cold shock CspA family protein